MHTNACGVWYTFVTYNIPMLKKNNKQTNQQHQPTVVFVQEFHFIILTNKELTFESHFEFFQRDSLRQHHSLFLFCFQNEVNTIDLKCVSTRRKKKLMKFARSRCKYGNWCVSLQPNSVNSMTIATRCHSNQTTLWIDLHFAKWFVELCIANNVCFSCWTSCYCWFDLLFFIVHWIVWIRRGCFVVTEQIFVVTHLTDGILVAKRPLVNIVLPVRLLRYQIKPNHKRSTHTHTQTTKILFL